MNWFENKVYSIVLKKQKESTLKLFNNLINKGIVVYGAHSYGIPYIEYDKFCNTKIKIGKYCSIADKVRIFNGSNHNTNWVSTYPFRIMFDIEGKYEDGQPSSKGDINIGNDVWIGYGSTIFSGVTIGDGAVIAAKTIVTKDVLPYTLVGGNKCELLKHRFTSEQIKELLKISWWNWDDEKVKEAIPLLSDSKIEEFINRYKH